MPHRFDVWTFLFAALLLAIPGLAVAQHPTAVTSIVNSDADTTLEVNHNGSLLMPGIFVNDGTENDSIPAEGAGTRLMWYPEKAAVRAGRVGLSSGNEDNWDASKVGKYSVAFGADTEASGSRALAMGFETTASAGDATAIGNSTTASRGAATAMGFETTASGFRATAMGRATTAGGSDATTMGLETVAATDQSLSIGRYNEANTSLDGTLFVVGNGTGDSDRSNALVLDDQGEMTIAGTLTENSDRRLKTSIEPLGGGALTKLSDIRPVRYEFRDQQTHPAGEQIGLIAQDVQEEFPELVSEGSDGMLSLAYPKMTAVLLKGLQEQQSTIKEQNKRIDRLEDRLAALEQQNSSALPAGLVGPWALALLLGLGGLATGLFWRRRN